MALPVPQERIDAYRELLRPCKLDVHGQMHSRPSVFCQLRWKERDCQRCQDITKLIHEDFAWKNESFPGAGDEGAVLVITDLLNS